MQIVSPHYSLLDIVLPKDVMLVEQSAGVVHIDTPLIQPP